ncbi:MAG TPA: hypothetical protein V6D43_02740 [Candidatus Sericytochromatia bacterium]
MEFLIGYGSQEFAAQRFEAKQTYVASSPKQMPPQLPLWQVTENLMNILTI